MSTTPPADHTIAEPDPGDPETYEHEYEGEPDMDDFDEGLEDERRTGFQW